MLRFASYIINLYVCTGTNAWVPFADLWRAVIPIMSGTWLSRQARWDKCKTIFATSCCKMHRLTFLRLTPWTFLQKGRVPSTVFGLVCEHKPGMSWNLPPNVDGKWRPCTSGGYRARVWGHLVSAGCEPITGVSGRTPMGQIETLVRGPRSWTPICIIITSGVGQFVL